MVDTIMPDKLMNVYARVPAKIWDELAARFIINIPQSEEQDITRVGFQIELAHWFYEDFTRKENVNLKSMKLKEFFFCIFYHVPYYRKYAHDVDAVYNEWRSYKITIPTCGAVIMDKSMSDVILVQSYNSSSWGFPKGKISHSEQSDYLKCAIREVLEETGFDVTDYVDESEYLEEVVNDQKVRLYMAVGVSKNEKFQTKTKCEIKCIKWWKLSALPTSKYNAKGEGMKESFFQIYPFIKKIRRWVHDRSYVLGPANCSLNNSRIANNTTTAITPISGRKCFSSKENTPIVSSAFTSTPLTSGVNEKLPIVQMESPLANYFRPIHPASSECTPLKWERVCLNSLFPNQILTAYNNSNGEITAIAGYKSDAETFLKTSKKSFSVEAVKNGYRLDFECKANDKRADAAAATVKIRDNSKEKLKFAAAANKGKQSYDNTQQQRNSNKKINNNNNNKWAKIRNFRYENVVASVGGGKGKKFISNETSPAVATAAGERNITRRKNNASGEMAVAAKERVVHSSAQDVWKEFNEIFDKLTNFKFDADVIKKAFEN